MKRLFFLLMFIFAFVSLFGQFGPVQRGVISNVKTATSGGTGVEMLADGTFTNGSDHWDYTNVVITNLVTYDAVNNYATVQQYEDNGMTALEVSTTYKLTFDVTSAGSLELFFCSYSQGITYVEKTLYTAGSKSLEFTTPGTMAENGFRVVFYNDDGIGGTIDNISVKKK
jgi:hypothetical protein